VVPSHRNAINLRTIFNGSRCSVPQETVECYCTKAAGFHEVFFSMK